jgi:hypothetical protein
MRDREREYQRRRRTRTGTGAWAGAASATINMDPLNAAQIRKRTSASGTDEAKPVMAAKAAEVMKTMNTRKATNRVIENASEISEKRQALKQVPHRERPRT